MRPLKYILSNLLDNEKLVYGVRPHWIIFSWAVWTGVLALFFWAEEPVLLVTQVVGHWSLDALISACLALMSIYWGIGALIRYTTSEYGVTNKRVLIKVGWIKRSSLELMLEKVEGVLVDQTIFGRLLNYGTITIIGTGGTKDSFPFIPDPLQFRKMVQEEFDHLEHKAQND